MEERRFAGKIEFVPHALSRHLAISVLLRPSTGAGKHGGPLFLVGVHAESRVCIDCCEFEHICAAPSYRRRRPALH